MSWNPIEATEAELRCEAEAWSNQFVPGEPGYCNPDMVNWRFDPRFDIACLGNQKEWAEWFDDECKMVAEDGRGGYYDDMLQGEIYDEIVVLVRDGIGYIWDGNHRTGAAFKRGLRQLKAIVGTPIEARQAA